MYGKIFDSMYEGTLYGHWQAIVTLQQMLVLCNSEGVVDMTPMAMSARTSIPLDIITEGIKTLSEPDPYTRTPGYDGKRIVLMDDHRPWGWMIVNYAKYQKIKNRESKLEADRARIAEKRKANKNMDVAGCSTESHSVADVAPIAIATTKAKATRKSNTRARETPLPDDFKISDRVSLWASQKGWSDLDIHLEHFIGKARAKGYAYVDWDEAFMGAIRDDWAGVRKAGGRTGNKQTALEERNRRVAEEAAKEFANGNL